MERCRKRKNKNSNQERSNRRKARKELQDYAEADLKEAKRIEEDSDEEVVHSGKVVSRKEKEARRKLNDLVILDYTELSALNAGLRICVRFEQSIASSGMYCVHVVGCICSYESWYLICLHVD